MLSIPTDLPLDPWDNNPPRDLFFSTTGSTANYKLRAAAIKSLVPATMCETLRTGSPCVKDNANRPSPFV